MKIKFLQAFNGDCILIETIDENKEKFTILIDGGTASTFDYSLKEELENLPRINLLILTHIDSDHIGGLIRFFKNSLIEKIDIDEIWINHPELISITTGELISFSQGDNLKELIQSKKPNSRITSIHTDLDILDRKGIQFEILSPTSQSLSLLFQNWKPDLFKEQNKNENISASNDISNYHVSLEKLSKIPFSSIKSLEKDITNASSIAFILKSLEKVNLVFLGDARPEILEETIIKKGYSSSNPHQCELLKLSHHGSKNNTSHSLLELIQTKHYFISTNGGSSSHSHPSRETIARIVWNNKRNIDEEIVIFTNYPLQELKNKIGDFVSDKDFESGNWRMEQQNEFIIE